MKRKVEAGETSYHECPVCKDITMVWDLISVVLTDSKNRQEMCKSCFEAYLENRV